MPSVPGSACAGRGSYVRLLCNRDESRQRAPARPPELRACGARQAIMPVDPVSDGTWIAVNDAGLVFCLLNVNPRPAPRRAPMVAGPARVSRGTIIPRLVDNDDVPSAAEQAGRLDPMRLAAFQLVIHDDTRIAHLHSDRRIIRRADRLLGDDPEMFTSSGLGDEVVEPPRRDLFRTIFRPSGSRREQQDLFHHHRWPDRPHLSVCMSRPDARTVSLTIVELHADRTVLVYHPAAPDEPAEEVRLELERSVIRR